MSQVFLSYSRKDRHLAERIALALADAGLDVWWDATLRAGETYDEVTETALRGARAVVVLWSPHSVSSRWVRSEATIGLRQETLLPVMIETCERPVMFELTQTADLSHWEGDAADGGWQSFVSDVKRMVGSETAAPSPVQLATRHEFKLPSKASIAVMPFATLGGEDYFADGMVEEISTALSRFGTLFVIAGQSSLSYRGTTKSAAVIGRELGVRYLLEGSVRRADSRLRIAVKLVDAIAGEQIWAERYDEASADIFEVQDRVAHAVACRLDSTLQDAEMRRASKRPTLSLDAHDACLAAGAKLTIYDRQAITEAVALAERAVEIDGDYAWALAVAAFCHGALVLNHWTDDPAATRERALELGERARRLGRDDETVLASLAGMHLNIQGDAHLADQLISRALSLNPDRPFSLFWGAWTDLVLDRVERALERFERAIRLNPRSAYHPFQLTGMAICLMMLDRCDEAAIVQTEALRLVPTYPQAHATLIASLVYAGRLDEADRAADQLAGICALDLAALYFREGRQRARVQQAFEQLPSRVLAAQA